MPFEAAKALAAKFCYRIRYALTVIFGPDFPDACLPEDHENFGQYAIEPEIIAKCQRLAEARRAVEFERSSAARGYATPATTTPARSTFGTASPQMGPTDTGRPGMDNTPPKFWDPVRGDFTKPSTPAASSSNPNPNTNPNPSPSPSVGPLPSPAVFANPFASPLHGSRPRPLPRSRIPPGYDSAAGSPRLQTPVQYRQSEYGAGLVSPTPLYYAAAPARRPQYMTPPAEALAPGSHYRAQHWPQVPPTPEYHSQMYRPRMVPEQCQTSHPAASQRRNSRADDADDGAGAKRRRTVQRLASPFSEAGEPAGAADFAAPDARRQMPFARVLGDAADVMEAANGLMELLRSDGRHCDTHEACEVEGCR